MNIGYTLPLSKGWGHMKKALFQPFDLNKWLRLGFTAWLAGLADCNGGSGGNNSVHNRNDWNDFFNFPQTAWDWLQTHPLWFNLIIIGIILVIIIGTVILWVSSRGKFTFLHNVAHEKDEINKPWIEYRKEGNSLFIWRFFFGWICAILFVGFFIHCFIAAKGLYFGDFPGIILFWKIAGMILIFLGLLIVIGYISLYLNDFIVPVMFKNRIGVNRAWMKFLPLFGRYFFHFVVYGLFIFILMIATAIAVISFALITCCIGLLLIAIPYIGSVVLLPVSYTFRAFSIEFLAQFGDEFNVFPKAIDAEEQAGVITGA
jgi:hypothetical protein